MELPVVGTLLAGKYEIVRLLGEGGMGAVFEAEHRLTHKRVAIKWLHPDLSPGGAGAARLLREAQAASRIRHSNVVDVYDVEREGDCIFLVMEFLEGETLTRTIARGDLEMHALIALLLPAMRGVAAAHRQGVVHRDIKPDNIFLAREEEGERIVPKVLDFGISKLEERGRVQASLTRTGSTVGTPLYMSYEQLSGDRALDGRADVYAFGVILYEALTGALPFDADSLAKLVVKIATECALSVKQRRPDIPGSLSDAIMHAIARQRDERTPSMEALIKELEPFASEAGFRAAIAEDLAKTSAARVPALPGVDARFLGQTTQANSTVPGEARLPLLRAPTMADTAVQAPAKLPTRKPFPFLRASERHARFEPSRLASSMELNVPQAQPLRGSLRNEARPSWPKWLAGASCAATLAWGGYLLVAAKQPSSPPEALPDRSAPRESQTPRTGELKPVLPTLPSTRSTETQVDDWNLSQRVELVATPKVLDASAREQAVLEPIKAPTSTSSSANTGANRRKRTSSADEAAAAARVTPALSSTHGDPSRAPGTPAQDTELAPAALPTSAPEQSAARDASSAPTEPIPTPFRVRPPRSQEF